MAQVRSTSRKTAPTKDKKPKTRSSMPWGLLLVVVVSGSLLATYAAGYYFNIGSFGQGLKNYHISKKQAKQAKQKEPDIKPVRTESTEKNYQFHEMLEGTKDRVLPDDFSVQQTARERAQYYFIMQIATLSSESAAEALRAKLALKDLDTRVEEKNGKYRLKMGPYSDKRSLKNARNEVKNTGYGLNPIGIQYKKK